MMCEGAGGAGEGGSGHDERSERGQHDVGVCDDGSGARGGDLKPSRLKLWVSWVFSFWSGARWQIADISGGR